MKRSLYMMSLVLGLCAAQAMQAAAAESDLAVKYPNLYAFMHPNGEHWIDVTVSGNHWLSFIGLLGQIYDSKDFQNNQTYRKKVLSELDAFLNDDNIKKSLDKFMEKARNLLMPFEDNLAVSLRTLKNGIPTESEIKKKITHLKETYPALAAVRSQYGDNPLITWASSTAFNKEVPLHVLQDSLKSKKELAEFKAFMNEYANEIDGAYLKGRLRGIEWRITD